MKRISAMSVALSVLVAAPLLMVSAVRAEAAPDFGVSLGFHVGEADVNAFYDQLAPYGDWVDTDRYGLCWAPRVSEQDWRPYYYGHWVYSDYGWTWVSDEEWGWGPYHYGRWAFDPAYGWVWVPGSEWAPAWVAWRWGDGYAGWAPLPPDADPSMGPADWGIDPLAFVFVPDRYVAEPVLVDRYVPPARNVTIVNVTRNVTNYTVVNDRVVNQGVPVQQVERVTGRAVPRVRIAEQTAPAPTRVRGNEVAIYKPVVPKATATTRPRTATRPPATAQRPPATAQHPTGPTTATQRPPAAAPPPTTDAAELQRRHAQEQQALAAKEAQEREKLRQIQEKEKASPPPNVSPQQLEKQQQAEQKAQAEHEQQQKQAQEQRQARERQAAQQAQQQRQQGKQQSQGEKQKNPNEKKKPESKQQ